MSNNPIQDNFVILCNKLDLDRILPVLCQMKMLTPDEYETLTNPLRPTKQRRELLLLLLPRKGSDHFQIFGRCLVWSGQAELAGRIGVDVSRVPPPPGNMPGRILVFHFQFHYAVSCKTRTPNFGQVPNSRQLCFLTDFWKFD